MLYLSSIINDSIWYSVQGKKMKRNIKSRVGYNKKKSQTNGRKDETRYPAK
jgi:hypothetical protein